MARRPIFIPNSTGTSYVITRMIEFKWFPGMSKSQKQKSIDSFHEAISKEIEASNILEISSKSKSELGVSLSAFNLLITTSIKKKVFSVESAFQASKVFQNGGPYLDLLDKTSREAKKDPRLKNSGKLLCFDFYNTKWPLMPKTLFYDWLYINALAKSETLSSAIINFNVFTDIEFNPQKSVNCQAYSAALYVSLHRRNLLESALSSKESYVKIITMNLPDSIDERRQEQVSLFNID